MPCLLNAERAKVHGQHVKGGFGAALYGGGGQRGKAVHALALQGLNQHGAGRVASKGCDQGGGQLIDQTRVHTQPIHAPADGNPVEKIAPLFPKKKSTMS